MPNTARQGRDAGPVTLTAAVTCHVCGTVPYDSIAEADTRAERHTKLTGHATTTAATPGEPGEAP